MTAFSDDFNRADGAIGANWTVNYGTVTIVSNQASFSAYANMSPTTAATADRIDITVTLSLTNGNGSLGYIYFATHNDFKDYYRLSFYPSSWSMQNILTSYVNQAGTQLVSEQNAFAQTGTVDVRVTYDGVTIAVYVNGDQVYTYNSTLHAGYSGVAIGVDQYGGTIDAYNQVDLAVSSMAVTPNPLWVGGGDVPMVATGTDTEWTPGVPGDTTLSVDHGTISDQVVFSPTEIRFTYTPDLYVGTLTFSESKYTLEDQVTITLTPPEGFGSGLGLSQAAIDYIERSAQSGTLPTIVNQEAVITDKGLNIEVSTILADLHIGAWNKAGTLGSDFALNYYGYHLLQWLTGGYEWTGATPTPPDQVTLIERLLDLKARWASDGPEPWTIQQLGDLLAGDPWASHQDILTALDGLTVETDLQPVLDAIAAAQGDPLATTKAVLDLVYQLDPTGTHNLAEVLTAIAAVRGTGSPDLAAVMTKLSQVQPSTSYTLSSLNTQGIDLKQLLDTLALVIGIVAPEAGTVAELISLIYDAVTATPEPVATIGPPVWIDEAHATIDSPIALSDGLLLEGPMDGVIVTITGARAGAGKFAFGDVTSWRYCGAVVFGTDRGDWEWAQPIGLESQIVTCKTMQHASSALFRLESGFTGTVQPFTVTAGT